MLLTIAHKRRFAAALFGWFGLAGLASAQEPPVTSEPPAATPVFPDDAFPATPPKVPTVKSAAAVVGEAAMSDYGLSRPGGEGQIPSDGVEYSPISSILPDYVYRASYYTGPGSAVSARPIADYAPPGFEPREFQDVPGAPEYVLLTPPPRLTPEERQKFVTRGLVPGSYLVPGSNTSFRFRGFVRLAGLYDFDPIGSRDDFVTNTIPVPQESGQNFNMSTRMTRFALESWTPTNINEWTVHTFIEADFFNGAAQAVGGGGNPFRLRFAFVDFGYFRVGQQNTVFMDGTAWPSTVDFAGPRGLLNQRRPGARVTLPVTDKVFWAGGIEQPFSDITTNGLGNNVQDVPDFATHVRYETDFGHAQVSALARAIGYQPTGGEVMRRGAWGVSGSTAFHPWALLIGSNPIRKSNATGLERSRLLAQYNCGRGIGRYIQDTAGLGLDAQVDPVTGEFDTVFAVGWSASYEHWYNERWLSNITYSADYAASTPNQPGTNYKGAKYLVASLWYIPIRNLSLGIEHAWGERENLDSQRAKANRVHGLIQYNF